MTASLPAMRTVLLIRPDRNDRDAEVARQAGWLPLVEPWLEVAPTVDDGGLAESLTSAGEGSWLLVTSPRTWSAWSTIVPALADKVEAGRARGLRIAASGGITAASLPLACDVFPDGLGGAEPLLALLPTAGTALIPGSARALPTLSHGLSQRGWRVRTAAVYTTRALALTPPSAAALARGEIDAVVVRSPSAVDALARHAGTLPAQVLAVGPTTQAAAHAHPWRITDVADLRHAFEEAR